MNTIIKIFLKIKSYKINLFSIIQSLVKFELGVKFGAIALFFLLFSTIIPSPGQAALPQNHGWQTALRTYISGMAQGDLEYSVQTWTAEFMGWTDEQKYKFWLLTENYARDNLPRADRDIDSAAGALQPWNHFSLDTIEDVSGDVYMNTDPMMMAFVYAWDYAGNPYHNLTGLGNRIGVATAVDLIMWAYQVDNNKEASAAHIGGMITQCAYPYSIIKSNLPLSVQSAFEAGLELLCNALEARGPVGVHADIDYFALPGLWYLQNLGIISSSRCTAYIQTLVDNYYKPAGYVDHGNGADMGYQGVTLWSLLWAQNLWTDGTFVPSLSTILQKHGSLKAYLTFTEPGFNSDNPDYWVHSPSHFQTSTSEGAAHDQSWSQSRDALQMGVTDELKYLAWGYRNGASWRKLNFPTPSELDTDISTNIFYLNTNWDAIHDIQPSKWNKNGYPIRQHFYIWYYYPSGLYSTLSGLNASYKIPPVERTGDYIKAFDNSTKEFIAFKVNGLAGVVHTGQLSWWNDDDNIPGFSGGALSAIWTVDGGTNFLGKMRGYAASAGYRDTWNNYDTWATHHVWGKVGNHIFTSARLRNPTRSYTINSQSDATVIVSGNISADVDADKFNVLNGTVDYQRTFDITTDGVKVTTTITSDQIDSVDEMWETLPLYGGYVRNSYDGVIEFKIGGNWTEIYNPPTIEDTTEKFNVEAIRNTRNGVALNYSFSSPVSVKLSSSDWDNGGYQVYLTIRNVHIRIANSGTLPASTSVSYTIKHTPSPPAGLKIVQ